MGLATDPVKGFSLQYPLWARVSLVMERGISVLPCKAHAGPWVCRKSLIPSFLQGGSLYASPSFPK